MTKFLKLLDARMNDTKFNKRFSQAVQPNQILAKENKTSYNLAKKNFYLAQDK